MSGETLIFDGQCGFCTSVARWAKGRLPSTVRVVPWQLEDLSRYGLTDEDTRSALVLIDGDGRIHRGHVAAVRALDRMRRPWSSLGRVIATPLFDRLAERIYELVARNRHRLPGGTPACAVPR